MEQSYLNGNTTLDEIIKDTNAMLNSNCAISNLKGTCCYSDLEIVYNKIIEVHKNTLDT